MSWLQMAMLGWGPGRWLSPTSVLGVRFLQWHHFSRFPSVPFLLKIYETGYIGRDGLILDAKRPIILFFGSPRSLRAIWLHPCDPRHCRQPGSWKPTMGSVEETNQEGQCGDLKLDHGLCQGRSPHLSCIDSE